MTTQIGHLIDRIQATADRQDSALRTKTLHALDEAVQWYARRAPWDGLFEPGEDFLTNGSEFLVLPERVARVVRVADRSNSQPVEPGGNDWERYPTFLQRTTGGTSAEWRPAGVVPVTRQPESAGVVTFSPDVSESFSVYVRGLVRDSNASGTALELYDVLETVVISSAADASTTNSFVRVDEVSKKYASKANITVKYSDGSVVGRIPSWSMGPSYQRIQLFNIPNAGTILSIAYKRRPDRLTAEEQVIDPGINLDAIIWRASGNIHWQDQETEAANMAWRKADEIVGQILTEEVSQGDRDYQIDIWGSYHSREGIGED